MPDKRCWIWSALLVAATVAGASAQETLHAFTKVTVIPMDGRGPLANQTVIVRAARIEAMGARIEIPPEAETIDGSGCFLIPGLADMHVHLEHLASPRELRLFIIAGVTTVRGMDGRLEHLEWRRRIAAGEIPGPSVWTSGRIVDGDPAFWPDSVSVGNAKDARDAVRKQKEAGFDFIKVYHQLDPTCYEAILDEARRLKLRVAGHVPLRVGLPKALASWQDCIEHLRGYPAVCEADDSPFRRRWHWSKLYFAAPSDPAKMRKIAKETAAAGVWNCPTLIVQEKRAPLPRLLEWLDDPLLRRVPLRMRSSWDPRTWSKERRRQFERLDDGDYQTIARGSANARAMVKALHDAGAGLLVGSDTPNPFVIPGHAVHEEMALFVRAGLSARDALRAATVEAARFMGDAEVWGTIAPGRRADLVLLGADPTKDIANTRKISGVMVAGQWLDAAALARLRAGLERDAAKVR